MTVWGTEVGEFGPIVPWYFVPLVFPTVTLRPVEVAIIPLLS